MEVIYSKVYSHKNTTSQLFRTLSTQKY